MPSPDQNLAVLRFLLNEQRGLEERIAQHVAVMREQGITWQEIGEVVGTSRQAAHKRWGRKPTG